MNSNMSDSRKIKLQNSFGIFDAFKMACINQYSFDALGYSNFNENIEKFSGLPRPAKWLGNKKIKTLIEKFSNILNFAWTFCFAYVYFFIIALRFIFSLKGRSRYGINIKNVDNLVLGVAPRSVFVFKSALGRGDNKYCLTLPWVNVSKELENSKFIEIKLLDVVDKKDIFKALCRACKAHAIASSDRNISFQTYIGINWFIVYFAIQKLDPKKIFTAEHHDRWAVLLDFIAENKKVGDDFSFSIVQHGLEHESTYLEMQKTHYGTGVGLPYKIKNVDVVYAYNEAQLEIIKNNILNSRKELSEKYFKVKLFLHDIGTSQKKKVMFVGHPFCYELQFFIYLQLSKVFDFDFYYKPHPTTEISDCIKKAGWHVIDEKDFFPKVDFLISYPSTLVIEYKELGINSFIHSLNEENFGFPLVAEKAIDFLGSNFI